MSKLETVLEMTRLLRVAHDENNRQAHYDGLKAFLKIIDAQPELDPLVLALVPTVRELVALIESNIALTNNKIEPEKPLAEVIDLAAFRKRKIAA